VKVWRGVGGEGGSVGGSSVSGGGGGGRLREARDDGGLGRDGRKRDDGREGVGGERMRRIAECGWRSAAGGEIGRGVEKRWGVRGGAGV